MEPFLFSAESLVVYYLNLCGCLLYFGCGFNPVKTVVSCKLFFIYLSPELNQLISSDIQNTLF